MTFLVDAQLPSALARWISSQPQCKASHVRDHDMQGAEDGAIWNLAASLRAVLVTKDEDFCILSVRTGGVVTTVWLRLGNATKQALIEWIKPRWPGILRCLADGDRLIEVR